MPLGPRPADPFGITGARLAREAEAEATRAAKFAERAVKRERAAREYAARNEALRKEVIRTSGGGHMLQLLRPSELAKYKRVALSRAGTAERALRMERGLNVLEAESGLDLDGDGDVGVVNRAATPAASERCYRADSYRGTIGARANSDSDGGLPSYRQAWMVPMSRDHATPEFELHKNRDHVKGIAPGYTGHVPRTFLQFGITTVGGLHPDATGTAEEYKLHGNQSNEIYVNSMKQADNKQNRDVRHGIPGYAGHRRGNIYQVGPRNIGSAVHREDYWYSA